MEPAIENKRVGIKDLFTYKSYIALLIANFISRFGDSVDAIAYSWMVYILTGSKLLMGTLFAVNCIPNIIFGFISGVFVDNYSKKKIIVLSDLSRGLFVSFTALLFLTHRLLPWHLFVITFINSTIETFSNPARTSILPLLLPKELFLPADSFSGSIISIAELIGMGAAGIIIAIMGISGAIFIDGVTFFISSLIITFIKVRGDVTSPVKLTKIKYIEGFKSGIAFLKKETLILITVLLAAFTNFCFTPFIVLKPAYVNDILKSGPEVLGILGVVTTIGIIIGGLVVGQFGTRFKNSQLIIFGLFSIGITYALFSIPGSIKILGVSPVVMAFIISFIFSFFIPVTFSPINAYIMQKTPQQFLGRVSSLMGIITLSSVPIASSLSGIITEYIPIPVVFIILGTLITITAFLLIFNKEFCNT